CQQHGDWPQLTF
nr:immunoglobulin light chain junction region [Macaca mulatta]